MPFRLSAALLTGLICTSLGFSQTTFTDPKKGEVPLSSRAGWNSTLIWQGEVGVWCVKALSVFPQYGCPEVVGLDDKGRLLVFTSYSGKWTPNESVKDGTWLGGIAHVDLDPRFEGPELYTGGNGGNVFRVTTHPEPRGASRLESLEIGHIPADDIHTMIGGDLLASHPGEELLAFTGSGGAYAIEYAASPAGQHENNFVLRDLGRVPGRVRDAILLPTKEGVSPWIVGVSRSEHLILMRLTEAGLESQVIAKEGMGLGRIALKPRHADQDGEPHVFYATRDDGVILRFAGNPGSKWQREIIYAGPQGPRGIAAGRFDADPAVETVAIFGYSHRVELLSRKPGAAWKAETIYEDGDQGHWISTAELDGRNTTDELIASGFGGRIVQITRTPGYGLEGIPHMVPDADPKLKAEAAKETTARGVRVAAKAASVAVKKLTPLCYQGGFETKSLVYETLVRRDETGRIAPLLAEQWSIEDGGKRVVFTLREGARFHDGALVTAEDVRVHFRRWAGLPEHSWLRCNERISEVRALDARRFEVLLDRPYPLLEDLCAINPCAIQGPGALDREGEYAQAMGTGPYRFLGPSEDGRLLRYERFDAHPDASSLPPLVELVRLEKSGADNPLDALLRDEVDVVLSSWLVRLDPFRVRELEKDARYQVRTGPGSCVISLGFALDQGPTADLALRQHIAATIDRAALVNELEAGLADVTLQWAAPSVSAWPSRKPSVGEPAQNRATAASTKKWNIAPLRIAPGREGYIPVGLPAALAAQLNRAGIPTVLLANAPRGGEAPADLRLEITHGVPYDPWTTLLGRFGPAIQKRTAETSKRGADTPHIETLLQRVLETPDEAARAELYEQVQSALDETLPVIPLYAPRRVAIVRAGLNEPTALQHDMYALDLRFLGAGVKR